MRRLLLAVFCGSGCLFPSLGGLSGDGSDASDAGDGSDATHDASVNARYCSGIDASFCVDFDDLASPLDAGWTGASANEMVLARDLDASSSPPASLVTALAVPNANDVAFGYLSRVFAADSTIQSYTLAFDLRVDAIATANEAIVGQLAWDGGAHRVYLNLGSDGTLDIQEDYVAADGGYATQDLFGTDKLPIGAPGFTRVTLVIGTNPPTATMLFGTKAEIQAQPLFGADFTGCEVDVGVLYVYAPTGFIGAHIDNVVYSQ